MKKNYFSILLVAAIPSTMSAQLEVLSNGNVFIKDGSVNSDAHLIVSNAPSLGFTSDNLSVSIGTHSQGYPTSTNRNAIGVIGESYVINSSRNSIGVWGEGTGSNISIIVPATTCIGSI